MAISGMDVQAVRTIAKQLQAQSQSLETTIAQIDKLVVQAQSVWTGKDAVQFASWWNDQHKPAMLKVKESIQGLGQSALNNAAEQEAVTNR